MNAMEIYNRLSRPEPSALKRITGGRLNGKSDINPQWRYKAMTEAFGLCGIGWKYTVDRQWTEQGAGDEVMAFVNISLYVKDGESWSEPIPGSGGSMLVAKEKNGPFNSDEAFKMATTDALSVAMKMIGVAADIYMGAWDGSKYSGQQPAQPELPSAQAECRRISSIIKIGDEEKAQMWKDSGQNWSNLLIMLKAKEAEVEGKMAELDRALDQVFDK